MSEESSGPEASPPVAAAPEVRVVVCTDGRPNRRSGRSKFEAPRTAHHEGDKTQGKRFEEKGSSARDAEDVSDDKANHHCGRRRGNSVVQMEDGRDEGDKEDTDDQEGNDRFQQRVTTSGVNQDEADGEDLPFPGFAPKTFMFFTQRNWLRFSCLRLITWPYPFVQFVVCRFSAVNERPWDRCQSGLSVCHSVSVSNLITVDSVLSC